jgi:nucleotide-binding universal stress UspA family protein
MRFHRLLVPHDFSSHADRALRVAAGLAGQRGELLLLHVVMPFAATTDFDPGMGFQVPIDELVVGARKGLARVIRRVVGRRHPKARIKVEIGDPYDRIVANTRGMDAVVMSTMGRTGLSHLVSGSVAEKVVRHSPIPVLTLRPAASRRTIAARVRTRRRRPTRRR